jgi:hypothetical protein
VIDARPGVDEVQAAVREAVQAIATQS